MGKGMRIDVEVLRKGQPKPYNDSYYEYIISFSWFPREEQVRWFVKAIHQCKKFSDEYDDSENETDKYFAPHLRDIRMIGQMSGIGGNNKWAVLIVKHYTD